MSSKQNLCCFSDCNGERGANCFLVHLSVIVCENLPELVVRWTSHQSALSKALDPTLGRTETERLDSASSTDPHETKVATLDPPIVQLGR